MNGEKSYSKSRNARWKSGNISDIATNPVYLGHTVQGKSQSSHFKDNGKAKRLPKEEWKIVENTHEPLVTEEQFMITMEMAEKSRKKCEERIKAHADIPKVENPLREKNLLCRVRQEDVPQEQGCERGKELSLFLRFTETDGRWRM